jgi:hypothetical protein
MTPTQFQSFVNQNDRSLLALRREISQSQDLDAATQLALEAILIKMRVAFLEYGKQILAVSLWSNLTEGADQRTNYLRKVGGEVTMTGDDFDHYFNYQETAVDLYYQNQEWLGEAFHGM